MIKQVPLFRSHIFNFFNRLAFLCLCAYFLYSCNDSPYEVGLNLLPAEDSIYVNQVDTFTLNAYTTGPLGIPSYDSVNIPFGNYNDAIFGRTTATELRNDSTRV